MWGFTATIFSIAVAAEFAGLGGVPAKDLQIENLLFIVLLSAFVMLMVRRMARR
jgi:uncharacterized membrane protein YtjA (UPF0391 family)